MQEDTKVQSLVFSNLIALLPVTFPLVDRVATPQPPSAKQEKRHEILLQEDGPRSVSANVQDMIFPLTQKGEKSGKEI